MQQPDGITRTKHETKASQGDDVIAIDIKTVHYGDFKAVRDSALQVRRHSIVAFIGPSGGGKSTVLRSFTRMNDLVPGCRVNGEIHYRGQNTDGETIDPLPVRRYIGMLFRQPNPFAMSVFNNVAFGPRLNG